MTNVYFFMFGLILGLGIYILLSKVFRRVDGFFIVNDNDSEMTRWTLQMKTNPYQISEKKMVHLKVVKDDEGGSV